jgi:polyisoprenoid-binding protein YceI
MKRLLILSAIALPLLSFTVARTTWDLDTAHAKLRFSITHMGLSDVEGSFRTISSKITASKEDLSDAVVEFTADAASVDTDFEQRDEHLKNADFFDVAKYPAIAYKSRSFTKVADGRYKVMGDLTMKGVTRPVELNATVKYGENPMSKKQVAGFKVTGTVDRTQFGVGGGMGSAMLSDEVEFTANAEFVKQ